MRRQPKARTDAKRSRRTRPGRPRRAARHRSCHERAPPPRRRCRPHVSSFDFGFKRSKIFTSTGSIKGSNFTCTLTTEERLASSRQNAPSRVAAPRPMGTYVASELPPPHPSVPPSRASPCRSSAARGGRNVPACVSDCAQKHPRFEEAADRLPPPRTPHVAPKGGCLPPSLGLVGLGF